VITRAAAAGAAIAFTTATLVAAARSTLASAPHGTPVNPTRAAYPAAYADGAPRGFSGGFGEQSCHACHFHKEINSGPRRVSIAGVPERFVAGERYPLTVTLSRPDIKLGGFQLTARFKDDGRQAGTFALEPGEEERIAVEMQGGVHYAGHRKNGTALAEPETARWSLVWGAPKAGGPIVLHVAATAADGDGTVEGDYVETAVVETTPSGTSARHLSRDPFHAGRLATTQRRSLTLLQQLPNDRERAALEHDLHAAGPCWTSALAC